jgi:hypothetical protein
VSQFVSKNITSDVRARVQSQSKLDKNLSIENNNGGKDDYNANGRNTNNNKFITKDMTKSQINVVRGDIRMGH